MNNIQLRNLTERLQMLGLRPMPDERISWAFLYRVEDAIIKKHGHSVDIDAITDKELIRLAKGCRRYG